MVGIETRAAAFGSVFIEKAIKSICAEIDEIGECHLEDMPDALEYCVLAVVNLHISYVDRLSEYSRSFPQIDSDTESDGEESILYAVCYSTASDLENPEIRMRGLCRGLMLALFPEKERGRLMPETMAEEFVKLWPAEAAYIEELTDALRRNLLPSDIPYGTCNETRRCVP